ncbi:MAG TPA: uracil phosphoribosyltransferase [Bacteroidia bacterium]|nr:uracil phosphoribosyltransferase [Bacteroidia bacterium]QQR95048.1 MAG: uracil phosphoribosyltransferase [Bacteroidota bacterium]MBP7714352.1 uracil phosphoribosyltransferase [Bacteroidia bacterium]MBP8668858.1 uracil phosphoribosyltransferase [Bacteroidia bacterium]HOZ89495.1 uracil phosphoribosyltransferase [Bacteroidia bacterium]
MVNILSTGNSLLHHFVAELRDVEIQNDRMRFRRNLERIGEIAAYEISKTMIYENTDVTTPLGIATVPLMQSQPVLGTILRAGLPLHQGLLNYFDQADNAFISAYRRHHKDGSFDIHLQYLSSPPIAGRVLILSDPMLATGQSLVETYKAMLESGQPAHTHVVAAIASRQGIEYVKANLPDDLTIWVAAVDEELTAQSYIVPGLGDAGDLAFGEKK